MKRKVELIYLVKEYDKNGREYEVYVCPTSVRFRKGTRGEGIKID